MTIKTLEDPAVVEAVGKQVDLRIIKQYQTPKAITNEGKQAIQQILNRAGLPYPYTPKDDEELSNWEWEVKEHPFAVGSLTKRLGKWLYVHHKQKLEGDLCAKVGTEAAKYVNDGRVLFYDFTDRFDWDSGDFGDGGSCYWGTNAIAKSILSGHDALCLRFWTGLYDPYKKPKGIGRAWVAVTKNFFVAFNSYWNGYHDRDNSMWTKEVPLTLMALMMGQQFQYAVQAIDLTNHGATCGNIYINCGKSFAIGPADVVQKMTKYDLNYDPVYRCFQCKTKFNREGDLHQIDYIHICNNCVRDKYDPCGFCGELKPKGQAQNLMYMTDTVTKKVCAYCYEHRLIRCKECDRRCDRNFVRQIANGDWYCLTCAEKIGLVMCHDCQQVFRPENGAWINAKGEVSPDKKPGYVFYCDNCKIDHLPLPEVLIDPNIAFNKYIEKMPSNITCEILLSRYGRQKVWFGIRDRFSSQVEYIADEGHIVNINATRMYKRRPLRGEKVIGWRPLTQKNYPERWVRAIAEMMPMDEWNKKLAPKLGDKAPDILLGMEWHKQPPDNQYTVLIKLADGRVGVGYCKASAYNLYYFDRGEDRWKLNWVLRNWDDDRPAMLYNIHGKTHPIDLDEEDVVEWTELPAVCYEEIDIHPYTVGFNGHADEEE